MNDKSVWIANIFYWIKNKCIELFTEPTEKNSYIIVGIMIAVFVIVAFVMNNSRAHTKNVLKNIIYTMLLVVCLIVVLGYPFGQPEKESSDLLFDKLLDRLDVIVSALLAALALKISNSQKNMQELEFCEKIGFHQFKPIFSSEVIKAGKDRYLKIKEMFINSSETFNDIYCLKLTLNNQTLNPRIRYTLFNVKVCDATCIPLKTAKTSIEKLFKKQVSNDGLECYEAVGFDYKINSEKQFVNMNIYIEEQRKPILTYLLKPQQYYQEDCKELSLILNFTIDDIGSSLISNNKLVVIISLERILRATGPEYMITETRSFAF